MENASLENVSIELIRGSQNRGDENEYHISSVFEDNNELETTQETEGEESCLASGISANINSRSRRERGAASGRPSPRETDGSDRDKSSAGHTRGAEASYAGRQGVQSDCSSVYLSASLDDIDAVPNSVTLIARQRQKQGEAIVRKTNDTAKEQTSPRKCNLTINFRLSEEHFCCNSRESSVHLELDIANFGHTRNRDAFPPQVSSQDQARKAARDAAVRESVQREKTLEFSSGGAQQPEDQIIDHIWKSRHNNSTAMDDFLADSTLDGHETPEYSTTDSDSSGEADTTEHRAKTFFSHSKSDSNFGEVSDTVASEGLVNEKNEDNCADNTGFAPDIQQSSGNKRQLFEENMVNLNSEGVEECSQSFVDNLDGNSLLSRTSLNSDSNSKETVVYRNVLENTAPDNISGGKVWESPFCDTEQELCEKRTVPEVALENQQINKIHLQENCSSEFLTKISFAEEDNGSEDHLKADDEGCILGNESLSDSVVQSLKTHEEDDICLTEGVQGNEKLLDDQQKPTDDETHCQGDARHLPTDFQQSGCTDNQLKTFLIEKLVEQAKNGRLVSNGEESHFRFSNTFEHVSEVPRGMFERILYKLYSRMNQRSPRAMRDISRGPCVKQLVKEFSREAMDTPKFPKSLSVPIQKTQQQIPKSQLSESFSDIDDPGFECRTDISTDEEPFSSDEVPLRSSTPSQEVVVMEIRDELRKPNCSRKRVIQLIRKFGGKGSYKKQKRNEDLINAADEFRGVEIPANDVHINVTNKDESKIVCEKVNDIPRKDSFTWLTNVSVKNLVSIFSEISKSPVSSPRSASRASRRCSTEQSKKTLTKPSRTTETQTADSEDIGSCSNVLLLVQPDHNASNLLGRRFERKRSTLSMCLPAAEVDDSQLECSKPASDQLRSCASATALLLVSTAEPVRVRTLCSSDDNCSALSQLAQLLQLPDRKARSRSVTRDSSLVRQMVSQWDHSSST